MKNNNTKKALTRSLKKLMKQKQLDKISVREITDDAGFNRQTFYYHFSDIYNLLEWMYQQEAIALFKDYEGEKLWQEGLLMCFNYFEENKEVSRCAIRSLGREILFRYFYDNVYEITKKTINHLSQDIELDENYKEMLAKYYILSFGSVLEQWILGRLDKTPEELIEFIDTMLQDQMRGVSLRFENHN